MNHARRRSHHIRQPPHKVDDHHDGGAACEQQRRAVEDAGVTNAQHGARHDKRDHHQKVQQLAVCALAPCHHITHQHAGEGGQHQRAAGKHKAVPDGVADQVESVVVVDQREDRLKHRAFDLHERGHQHHQQGQVGKQHGGKAQRCNGPGPTTLQRPGRHGFAAIIGHSACLRGALAQCHHRQCHQHQHHAGGRGHARFAADFAQVKVISQRGQHRKTLPFAQQVGQPEVGNGAQKNQHAGRDQGRAQQGQGDGIKHAPGLFAQAGGGFFECAVQAGQGAAHHQKNHRVQAQRAGQHDAVGAVNGRHRDA